MNKREAVLAVLDAGKPQDYIPAGFFLHFGPGFQAGEAAVSRHLEFFRSTGMDFVKIQFEAPFPILELIQRPEDWAKMPLYGKDFYQAQLDVVSGLVRAAKSEALVVITLYSPFMCAAHTVNVNLLASHIAADPAAVSKGMEILTESLMIFVKECIRLGVDGFYHSTQGGEDGRLPGQDLFDLCVRPFDLALMNEAKEHCPFNILHVCDYHGAYADLSPFVDYPGHVVNCNPHVGGKKLTGDEISRMFGRPFMGGVERMGPIATGGPDDARLEARAALQAAPERFILAADCTVPGSTPWDNLKAAIDEAHHWKR